MTRINLRPWREELRAEKQKQFVVMVVGAAIIAGGLTFLWNTDLDSSIAYQQSRNAYIESAAKKLDEQIREIESLKRKRDELLARMKGMSESNSRVSTLMRQFEESDWFTSPNLSNVSSADSRRAGYSQFTMTVQQKTPEPEGEDK
jgi:type IV pilus assembly protein PilN